ncbi:hypothetical protein GCM10027417_24720 [Glutamicibacter endophyticus]
MSESLVRNLEQAAGQLAEAMKTWHKTNRRRESLAVALADSLLASGNAFPGIELHRKAKEAEEDADIRVEQAQAAANAASNAWKERKQANEETPA